MDRDAIRWVQAGRDATIGREKRYFVPPGWAWILILAAFVAKCAL